MDLKTFKDPGQAACYPFGIDVGCKQALFLEGYCSLFIPMPLSTAEQPKARGLYVVILASFILQTWQSTDWSNI